MDKIAWKGRILDGKKAEYIKRHDEIWPEMAAVLKEAGICNYTIWCDGMNLFGYYECEKGAAYALEYQASSPVVAKWNVSMQGIMQMEKDPATGERIMPERVFTLD